jgi:hypothetical protein
MSIYRIVEAIVQKIIDDNDGQHWDFVVPGYAGKRIVAYQSMREDLLLCLDPAKILQTEKLHPTITSSLHYAIVSLYWKCFSDATNAKYPKLETKDCFNNDDQELLITHKLLIELRNTLAAHRDDSEYDVGVAYLKPHIQDGSRQIRVKQRKKRKPTSSQLTDYINLFEHIIKVVEEHFEKAGKKVWDHMIKDFTPKELSMLRIAGPDKPIPGKKSENTSTNSDKLN